MAKRKFTTGQSFSPEVSDAIRFHAGMHNMLDSQRDTAFDERDGSASEKHNAGKGSPEYTEACERHSDAIEKIDDMNSRMKFHSKSMVELARNADSPGLEIVYDYSEEPPAKPKGANKAPAEDKAQLKIQPDAPLVEGESQQMAADPSALDISGPLTAKLRKAGIVNIAQLAALYDDESKDARAELNLTENQASELAKQLKAYRRRHRAAIAEAEQEGAAPRR